MSARGWTIVVWMGGLPSVVDAGGGTVPNVEMLDLLIVCAKDERGRTLHKCVSRCVRLYLNSAQKHSAADNLASRKMNFLLDGRLRKVHLVSYFLQEFRISDETHTSFG